jgi:hypothetical protein
MNKLAFAQALVPIADYLDERGFEEELAELDEIIEQLATEAKAEARMTKDAQMTPLQQVWQRQPGQSAWAAWNPSTVMGKALQTGPAAGQTLLQGYEQLGGQAHQGDIGSLRVRVQQIDQQIANFRQQIEKLVQQKNQLQQQGFKLRTEQGFGKQKGQQDVSKYQPYLEKVQQQTEGTQQLANR